MEDWNTKYRDAGGGVLFGQDVNPYVRIVRRSFTPHAQSALCLADGDGRNSRWLAKDGLHVTAVDISSVGTQLAADADQRADIHVARVIADMASWSPPPEQAWDSVFIMYLQCEADVRLRTLRVGWAALAKGGVLALEAFARPIDGQGSWRDVAASSGPGHPHLLYTVTEILDALPHAEIIEALEGVVHLDEGLKHQGPGHIVRFSARKL
ncbi:MAG: class I SAM-dependent methyltransferase [Pseudomonadota bacterium]